METKTLQQEILLFTTTSFSQREWSERVDNKESRSPYSASEKLQEACWNGLLSEMLPGVIESEKFFIWKIQEANNFLCVDLSEAPSSLDMHFSINPYEFLPAINCN